MTLPMQWLIDILAAKVIAEIGIPPVFIDRGDPSDYDFRKAAFTTDGTWHGLSLASIIPEGTSAVLAWLALLDDYSASHIQFREYGNTNAHNSSVARTQVAHVYFDQTLIFRVDSNRIVEYRASNTIFSEILFVVRGWWL